jgi:hypothetical protein
MHCEGRAFPLHSGDHAVPGPGGANRDRTGDLLLAKQALSQLSYGPGGPGGSGWIRTIDPRLIKTVL